MTPPRVQFAARRPVRDSREDTAGLQMGITADFVPARPRASAAPLDAWAVGSIRCPHAHFAPHSRAVPGLAGRGPDAATGATGGAAGDTRGARSEKTSAGKAAAASHARARPGRIAWTRPDCPG